MWQLWGECESLPGLEKPTTLFKGIAARGPSLNDTHTQTLSKTHTHTHSSKTHTHCGLTNNKPASYREKFKERMQLFLPFHQIKH